MENTYWASKGTHQQYVDALNALIPATGAVSNPRSANKALERFRRASNAYYDIFNNGGCNRASTIRHFFGVNMSYYRVGYSWNWNGIHRLTEPKMDELVLAAAIEQKLVDAEA